ncbi:AMP-binding protein [Micromonospora narathiwatensis]|uniref:Long-chain acyl-CoA synthetase (AMP-forming) n=1 Tax=Micromonospora narathiwatensis TaxID=299146 RepID=A0A1A8ZHH0_9ACTN|nr:AMP-binding protein [Micromonospora narathiwatensis]SBT43287.1 Long-chain acyl-CoA synthetase (AMP-forming) [Micromonospora narathiwatensis]
MLIEERLARLATDGRALVELLDDDGGVGEVLSYRDGVGAAWTLADRLRLADTRPVVGVLTGNTPEFVVADLALLLSGAVEVPVPLAFSADQANSLLREASVCLVDEAGRRRLAEWGTERVLPPGCRVVPVELPDLVAAARAVPPEQPRPSPWRDEQAICKVVHTSGTTSRPKGVRIRGAGLDALLRSLDRVMPAGAYARYLSLAPFSLLIEQVAAIYLVICHGGTVVLLPPDEPLIGTSSFAASGVLRHTPAARPTALVATPALAEELADRADRAAALGRPVVPELFGRDEAPLICCGGAPVDAGTLHRLDRHGLVVYEGYGLSENSSTVSWNAPGNRRIGTVGQPLDHVEVRLADDGELLVRSSSLFAGYTGTDPSACLVDDDGWLHTGDLAEIEESGHIRIVGRKKNVIVTSAGRNIAPEWVEAQYATLPFVQASAVVGDGLQTLHGLFLVSGATDDASARRGIAALGADRLSVVERVSAACVLPASDELYGRYFTVTGRPRRDEIRAAIADGRLPCRPLDPPTDRPASTPTPIDTIHGR